ncbi:hypothetical protein B0J11DRAFT_586343 [Dendryphion nanum]|uniref:Uncharacterized protein n=1 Tax=Dendryphion nanum TaxID=256645 RepID=A0A9P9I6X4_9PLEO|nr:hypothetical protein B0J11DRAFT_586343 [Dendryphion nanum]
MRSLIFSTIAFLTGTLAIPTPLSDPIRILPKAWEWSILDLKGPSCPDLDYKSEIYFNIFAYPYLNATITKEFADYRNGIPGPPALDYRLRPHKNGTLIDGVYDLEEGVTADWKFTYDVPSKKKSKYQPLLNTPFVNRDQWKAPECGVTIVKFRIDLTITSDKPGKKGIAISEPVQDENGNPANYGTWVGVSFDFEKCT